jgi:hypothetical protein
MCCLLRRCAPLATVTCRLSPSRSRAIQSEPIQALPALSPFGRQFVAGVRLAVLRPAEEFAQPIPARPRSAQPQEFGRGLDGANLLRDCGTDPLVERNASSLAKRAASRFNEAGSLRGKSLCS